ncbi:MAG: CC_3452 family protein [Caulobacterales bacterium]
MKLHLAAAALAVVVFAAGSAMAAGGVTATIESPVAKRIKLIAAESVWVCEKDSCVTGRTPDAAFGPPACQELAKQVGRISDYKGEVRSLTAAELDKCNSVVHARR